MVQKVERFRLMHTPLVSVILPVYNVERYLRECMDSLLGQTLRDFELICVDDGSTDSSGLILDEYALHDPRVRVLHCQNRGVACARNAGLDIAAGEFVYTCDSDDICHPRLLETMVRQMRRDNADVVCCERASFDCNTGMDMGRVVFPEWLWRVKRPFPGRSLARDLFMIFGNSTCDKLFRRELIESEHIRFIESVRRFVSFYFTSLALVLAKRISLVPESLYLYRENREGSLQNTREKAPVDVFAARAAMVRELERRGLFDDFAPGFLISFLRVVRTQLRGTREDANRRLVFDEAKKMVTAVMSRTGFPVMDFAWREEYRWWRGLELAGGPGEWRDAGLRKFSAGAPSWLLPLREKLRSMRRPRTYTVAHGMGLRVRLDFMRVMDGKLRFEGQVFCDRADAEEVFASLEIVAASSGVEVRRRLAEGSEVLASTPEYGVLVKSWRFVCSFPVPSEVAVTTYRWHAARGVELTWLNVEHTRYSPFTRLLRFSYAKLAGLLFSFRDGVIAARPDTRTARFAAECLLCANLLRKHSRIAFKALALRLAVRAVRMCRRRPLWLFSDRVDSADDNARAMFEYVSRLPLADNSPRCVFSVSRRASEVTALRRYGRVVDMESFRYKLTFLLSDCVVSAYHTRLHRFPFDDTFAEFAKDLVLKPRFMLLRHGVLQNDTSRIQNRWLDNAAMVATVSRREHSAFASPSYGYTAREVALCGFPRYDLLGGKPRKIVTFMPTWRANLIEWDEKGRHALRRDAADSLFVKTYRRLLSDAELIDRCERAGYTLQVKAHPNLSAVIPLLKADSRVRFRDATAAYRDVFAETNLLVTDYSSVAFDFAYMRRPVVYFQFDSEEFFSSVYRKGYFDCARDGFGPVERDLEALKRMIGDAVESGCPLLPEYRARMDAFFAFNDCDNRKRVYEAILAASGRQ